MKGQWLGNFEGSTGKGTIFVNIDERESCYQGVAYTHPDGGALPSAAAFLKTPEKSNKCRFRTDALLPLDATGNITTWDTVKDRYAKDVVFSKHADVNASCDGASLTLDWVTDLGITGNSTLPRSRAGEPSELDAMESNWEDFKKYVSGLKSKRYLFRGQGSASRLRTAFHRSGRADITRFHREDLLVLRNRLAARTKHVFNFNVPDEFGAFMSLIQHHGYPTPLLDWTYSPFVAAFFAYRKISNRKAANADLNEKVRVFILDQEEWRADWQQILLLPSPAPHLSVAEFMAIENERIVPQQAATTVTSVDDIESYIRSKEQIKDKQYLTAIDLPVRDRQDVTRDLRYMGITAGSLFPGLDGACEELADQNFGS